MYSERSSPEGAFSLAATTKGVTAVKRGVGLVRPFL